MEYRQGNLFQIYRMTKSILNDLLEYENILLGNENILLKYS